MLFDESGDDDDAEIISVGIIGSKCDEELDFLTSSSLSMVFDPDNNGLELYGLSRITRRRKFALCRYPFNKF